jgi:hypothetical protein
MQGLAPTKCQYERLLGPSSASRHTPTWVANSDLWPPTLTETSKCRKLPQNPSWNLSYNMHSLILLTAKPRVWHPLMRRPLDSQLEVDPTPVLEGVDVHIHGLI